MSKNESGHAINAANLNTMIVNIKSYGNKYATPNKLIQLPALEQLEQDIQSAMSDVSKASTVYTLEVAKCAAVFNPIQQLSTQIANAFRSSEAPDSTIERSESINRSIQPPRSKPKKKGDDPEKKETAIPALGADTNPTPNEPDRKQISRSQQGRDQKIAHLEEYILLAEETAEYQPAETEVQTATLRQVLKNMRAANEAVKPKLKAYRAAMDQRDLLMYAPKTGLTDRMRVTKSYVDQVFKPNSSQSKECRALEFRDLANE